MRQDKGRSSKQTRLTCRHHSCPKRCQSQAAHPRQLLPQPPPPLQTLLPQTPPVQVSHPRPLHIHPLRQHQPRRCRVVAEGCCVCAVLLPAGSPAGTAAPVCPYVTSPHQGLLSVLTAHQVWRSLASAWSGSGTQQSPKSPELNAQEQLSMWVCSHSTSPGKNRRSGSSTVSAAL